MPGLLIDTWNIFLMVVGFSLVIVIHELGHFLAARWAGIRVHAFAVGFGRALVSYRRGLGFRLGSSEREYAGLLADQGYTPSRGHLDDVADTEYRLNWLPFGGYVRMLGQEDANPNASSTAADSYTQKPVWKRMIVISGGVIMNVILAAVLFVVVFLVGMKEVPALTGEIVPDSPAANAGLRTGDVVLEINGRRAQTFTDLSIASAMSGPNEPVEIVVQRAGERLTFNPTPRRAEGEAMKTIGVAPPQSLRLMESSRQAPRQALMDQFADAGLEGVEPSMAVVAIDGEPVEPRSLPRVGEVRSMERLRDAARASGGEPLTLTFRDDASGRTIDTTIEPVLELSRYAVAVDGEPFPVDHLLGLVPLMKVQATRDRGHEQGLRAGDVFLRVGDAEFPSIPVAIQTVRRHAGRSLSVEILRDSRAIDLEVSVGNDGLIGFSFAPALGTPVVAARPTPSDRTHPVFAATRIEPPLEPGSLIVAVDDTPIASLIELRAALKEATHGAEGGAPSVALTAILPGAEGRRAGSPTTHTWSLTTDDVESLRALAWTLDPNLLLQFQVATIELRASEPLEAVVMGVRKTHRIMLLTYLTFQRLAQGTVSPKELRGPVGITHIGSQYAAQGFVYLLFFLALISANLAVINFLPIPIVDGGLFVMLLYEGITRRQVPIVVQNIATAVGLALILTAFIFVTFNDIQRLF